MERHLRGDSGVLRRRVHALAYSISYGIAAGFITYCIVKTCKKEAKSVHPIIWIVSLLFILNFILLAVL